MCRTFYHPHQHCECICVSKRYIPCSAYLHAHSELIYEKVDFCTGTEADPTAVDPFADPVDPFTDPNLDNGTVFGDCPRHKLVTRRCKALAFTYDDIDYLSKDVDDAMAPRGLVCPEFITPELVTEAKGDPCLLCDKPELLELLQGLKEGKGTKEKGKEKNDAKEPSALRKTGTAAIKFFQKAVKSGAKRSGGSSGDNKKSEEKKEAAEKRAQEEERNFWYPFAPPSAR